MWIKKVLQYQHMTITMKQQKETQSILKDTAVSSYGVFEELQIDCVMSWMYSTSCERESIWRTIAFPRGSHLPRSFLLCESNTYNLPSICFIPTVHPGGIANSYKARV
jgi:hypothetical protein